MNLKRRFFTLGCLLFASGCDGTGLISTVLNPLELVANGQTQQANASVISSPDKLEVLILPDTQIKNLKSFKITIRSLARRSTLRTETAHLTQGNGAGGLAAQSISVDETLQQLNARHKLQTPIRAGTMYINGQELQIRDTDTLASIFEQIHQLSGQRLKVSLLNASKIDLQKGQFIELFSAGSPMGLQGGSSNLLEAFQLKPSPGQTWLRSQASLNGFRTDLPLDASLGATNLAQTLKSKGLLTINGVAIPYSPDDTLAGIIYRINQSPAGVWAMVGNENTLEAWQECCNEGNNAPVVPTLGGEIFMLARKMGMAAPITVQDSNPIQGLADILGLGQGGQLHLGAAAQLSINGGIPQLFGSNSEIRIDDAPGIQLSLLQTGQDINVTFQSDSPSSQYVQVGSPVDLRLNVFNRSLQFGEKSSLPQAIFTLADPNSGSIDKQGQFIPSRPGTATIFVQVGTVIETFELQVHPSIESSSAISRGSALPLSTTSPSTAIVNNPGQNTSTPPRGSTVAGTPNATTSNSSQPTDNIPTSLTFQTSTLNFGHLGETFQLMPQIKNQSGQILDAISSDILWESSNPQIIQVDAQGKLTVIGSGFALVTAKLKGTTIQATISANIGTSGSSTAVQGSPNSGLQEDLEGTIKF